MGTTVQHYPSNITVYVFKVKKCNKVASFHLKDYLQGAQISCDGQRCTELYYAWEFKFYGIGIVYVLIKETHKAHTPDAHR